AGSLPSRPRPDAARRASVISGGKPCGNVAIARSVTRPAISQCPVMVSLPADASFITPTAPRAAAAAGTPAMSVTCPSPSAPRFGSARPPRRLARFPSVSAPSSPYARASGAPPHPTPSATTMIARSMGGIALLCIDGSRPSMKEQLLAGKLREQVADAAGVVDLHLDALAVDHVGQQAVGVGELDAQLGGHHAHGDAAPA